MSEQKVIIGFAGCKQAGKSTASNYLHSLAFPYLGLTPRSWVDNETGDLIVDTDQGEEGVVKLDNQDPEFILWMADKVWGFIRQFSCAGALKRFVVDVLGLNPENVYGTNEQKNELTDYTWEQMPIPTENTGPMTHREILQYFGGDVFRSIHPDLNINATLREIDSGNTYLNVISDIRYPNEVEKVKERGGKVIYLARRPHEDEHNSEVSLLPENFDHSKFDAIVPEDYNIDQMCEFITNKLIEWKVMEAPAQEEKVAHSRRNVAEVRPKKTKKNQAA